MKEWSDEWLIKKAKELGLRICYVKGEIMKDKNVNIEAVKVYDDLREKLSRGKT